jgi:hypothetical protein
MAAVTKNRNFFNCPLLVGQKWDYPRTIPAKFGLIWFSGFREEDLNVKVYNVRQMAKAHLAFGQVS